MAGRRRTRRLPTTGDLFGIKVAAAPAEADYNLDAVAGRRTHTPLKGSRLSSATGRHSTGDGRSSAYSSRLCSVAQLLGVIHRHRPHGG